MEWIKYEDAIKKTINFKSFVYKKAYSELSNFCTRVLKLFCLYVDLIPLSHALV